MFVILKIFTERDSIGFLGSLLKRCTTFRAKKGFLYATLIFATN